MASAMPGKRGVRRPSLISQAATTAKQGLRNSLGCSEMPGSAIQRRAPLISTPITSVAAVSSQGNDATDDGEAADLARRQQRHRDDDRAGQRQEEHLLEDEHVARLADALGDGRAGGEHHHVAEADQRGDRDAASSGRPSTTSGRASTCRRAKGRHQAAFPRASSRTSAAKRSPRASKPVNWSKLAQAGDSSTTGARSARGGGEGGGHGGVERAGDRVRHAVRGEGRGERRRVAADQQRAGDAREQRRQRLDAAFLGDAAGDPDHALVAAERARGGVGVGRLAVVDEARRRPWCRRAAGGAAGRGRCDAGAAHAASR